MPDQYVAIRDKEISKGTPPKQAKAKAARIYNARHPGAPVGPGYDRRHPPGPAIANVHAKRQSKSLPYPQKR